MRSIDFQKRTAAVLAWAAALAVVASASGCNTVPIEDKPAIRVPPGLSERRVELALMDAVFGVRPATQAEREAATATLTDRPDYIQIRRSDWRFEGSRPGMILASVAPRQHYLRVQILYDSSRVEVLIDDAINMNYDGYQIHPKAMVWIANLEGMIRNGLSLASIGRD